jgi:hypothetical protein
MLQTDSGAGRAVQEAPLTRPPGVHGRARGLVVVLWIAATLGIVVFVALVIGPAASAAGGCGGG